MWCDWKSRRRLRFELGSGDVWFNSATTPAVRRRDRVRAADQPSEALGPVRAPLPMLDTSVACATTPE